MDKKVKELPNNEVEAGNIQKSNKTCFIIMPISDMPSYEPGHFDRVYEYIIKPACINAGFEPIRADDIKSTNVIVIDIIKRILDSEMALCDLSSRNPNVLYELAIRQSFDLPVTLIKDNFTERIFDIQGFRDIIYDRSLRFDHVQQAISAISIAILNTYKNKGKEVNSIVELLGISKATLKSVDVSNDTNIILKHLNSLTNNVAELEALVQNVRRAQPNAIFKNKKNEIIEIGDYVNHPEHGHGRIIDIKNNGQTLVVKVGFAKQLKLLLDNEARELEGDLPF